jgi:V-type H+-transporting ATPase subunit a
VNPAVFTIITFPFLFAVMFGDFGHGILLTIFALWMIKNEDRLGKSKLNELFKTCFGGRYLLVLMGVFSIYTGFIYNECFSVAMDIFGTNWEFKGNSTTAVRINPDRTYPVGVDPAWNGAPNGLNYYNSLKMKLSIVLGVSQMCLGIFLSLLNGLHHHSKLDIFCEFVPQIIFMLSIFGYMVFLIFYKWAVSWDGVQPPFLLNVMIYMYLSIYKLADENKLFEGQLYVQWFCIFFTVITIPWMLLPKPLILKRRYQNKLRAQNQIVEIAHKEGAEESEEGFEFGEVFVKQIIHTIEFVLGAISNTASYLRLWALSLAHSELSLVFYERVLLLGYADNIGLSIVMLFCTWGAWAGVTTAVLMVMESLSAFLHALRLHWVEFQNKFYHGDGVLFNPFSYERILAGPQDE